MTAKTPKDEDPDIIEGVAVEKSAPSGRRGRSGGKTGSSRRKPAAESSDAADQASASVAPDAASLSTGPGLPLVISIAALLLVLAVAGYQIWQAGRSDAALRAEMAAMAGHLDEARDGMALLRQELDAARAGQAGLGARVDSVEAALPVDPSAELAALSTRLEKMEDAARTAKRSAASGMPPIDSERGLAHAGMVAVAAMTAADAGGGDPAQWLPVLRRISDAGLELGDLGRLDALVRARPPSSAVLLADIRPLVDMMDTDEARSSGTGWWDSATGRLGDFIRFRRSDADVSSNRTAEVDDSPLQKMQRAAATGGLQEALDASRDVTAPPEQLRAWQEAVTRRLELDAALAALGAAAASRLAAPGVSG